MPMTRDELLATLQTVDGLPETRKGSRHRTIYEAGIGARLRPSGQFYVDYASFPDGSAEEVPFNLITELESEGIIVRQSPDFKSWTLARRKGGS